MAERAAGSRVRVGLAGGVVADRASRSSGSAFRVGAQVEVRDRFQGSWSGGFEIAGLIPGGYALRRLSDRSVLPVAFADRVLRSNDAG